MTDEELLYQMKKGDSAALETLFYRYHVQIHKYLYRMLGSKTLAEDLTQECFIRVMESVKQKHIPSSFRPWFYKIASNLCKDIWRKASYRNETLNDEKIKEFISNETVRSRNDHTSVTTFG
jgi:RNA polymerase sigma factor (sigma-70 family)